MGSNLLREARPERGRRGLGPFRPFLVSESEDHGDRQLNPDEVRESSASEGESAPPLTPPASPAVVTGAAGFIGRHLVERLLVQGVDVRALLLPDEPEPVSWGGRAEVVRGDVTDAGGMASLVEGAGTVFHLAAVVGDWGPEELFQRVGVGGTENVLGPAAEAGARAVLASSIVVYGHRIARGSCPESTPFGRAFGPYGRAKQAQERRAWELADATGLELSVVRPANVFGVGSRPWVEMVLPLLRARQPTLIGGGDYPAGLCHVHNLVDVLVLAATHPRAVGRAFNAADGSEITWRRYFGDLAEAIDAPAPRSVPRWLGQPLALGSEALWRLLRRPNRPPMTREALNLAGSANRIPIDRARQELGWQPSVTYDEAMAELWAHLHAAS